LMVQKSQTITVWMYKILHNDRIFIYISTGAVIFPSTVLPSLEKS